jgi:hypothetical protein
MRTSEAIDQLLPALCAARAVFGPIPKNQTATVRSDKGHYSFQYGDLSAILDAVTPALTAHGLLLTFGLDDTADGHLVVSSRVYHCASAQYLENALSAPKPTGMTAIGSLITYLRRYTSGPLLGVAADDDDDGAAADGSHITLQASNRETITTPVQTNGNGHPPAALKTDAVDRPTAAHIEALFALAEQCHEEPEVFEVRLRTVMGLKPSASVARKLLPRTMTMEHYMRAVAYYQTLLAQLDQVKESVSAPASVPVADERAQARDALRAEALDWGIKAAEIDHILTHHTDLGKARALLWRARRPRADALVAAGA